MLVESTPTGRSPAIPHPVFRRLGKQRYRKEFGETVRSEQVRMGIGTD